MATDYFTRFGVDMAETDADELELHAESGERVELPLIWLPYRPDVLARLRPAMRARLLAMVETRRAPA